MEYTQQVRGAFEEGKGKVGCFDLLEEKDYDTDKLHVNVMTIDSFEKHEEDKDD